MSILKRLWQHMRSLWPRWTLLPLLPFVVYGVLRLALQSLRPQHALLITVAGALAYGTQASRAFFVGSRPLWLVGLVYDGMRPFASLGLSPTRVQACYLRELELRTFGITVEGRRTTLQEWFQRHSSSTLDVLCAIPYGTFVFASIAAGVLLYARSAPALRLFAWSFFAVNMAGFVTYHLYPAAPPWYVHAHGCSIDLLTKPSEGPALTRVDALIGVPYFARMYAHSSSVFGAVPSLHVTYPLLILLSAWPMVGGSLRMLCGTYFAWMCFAAIYLDHHWTVDVLVGVVYAIVSFALVRYIASMRDADAALRV